MRVKAKQYMYYARKEYQAGEEYDMDDREEQDAKLLQALGKIEIIKIPTKAAPKYQAAVLKVEEKTVVPPPAEPMTTESGEPIATMVERRTYRRR